MIGGLAPVLVIGYGNPARQDDGLGPALAAAIEKLNLDGVTVDSGYQLGVEDAEAAARYRTVVFADAATEGPEPFGFKRLAPETPQSFSSHSVSPAAVLALARDAFGAETAGYLLAIRGYSFEMFVETLTEKAAANLAAAEKWLAAALRAGDLGPPAAAAK